MNTIMTKRQFAAVADAIWRADLTEEERARIADALIPEFAGYNVNFQPDVFRMACAVGSNLAHEYKKRKRAMKRPGRGV